MSVEAASVLRQLFDVSGGRQWLRQDGWLKGDPCAAPGWASSSHYDCFSGDLMSTRQPLCCELTPGSNRPKVVRLDLSSNGLAGTLPRQLSYLDELRLLVLDGNAISGTIPSQFGRLRKLSVLWLQYNKLSGTLPTQLSTLSLAPHGCLLHGNAVSHECGPDSLTPPACNASYAGSPTGFLAETPLSCIANRSGEVAVSSSSSSTFSYEEEESRALDTSVIVVLSLFGAAMAAVVLREAAKCAREHSARRGKRQTAAALQAAITEQRERMQQRRNSIYLYDVFSSVPAETARGRRSARVDATPRTPRIRIGSPTRRLAARWSRRVPRTSARRASEWEGAHSARGTHADDLASVEQESSAQAAFGTCGQSMHSFSADTHDSSMPDFAPSSDIDGFSAASSRLERATLGSRVSFSGLLRQSSTSTAAERAAVSACSGAHASPTSARQSLPTIDRLSRDGARTAWQALRRASPRPR